MTAIPATRTWTAGEVVTDTMFNSTIRDVCNFLLAPPIFRARQTVAQSIVTSTNTALTFTTEDVDSAGGHSTSVNTSRYTAVYPGWYVPSGGPCFETNATGIRLVDWGKNGTAIDGCRDLRPAVSGFVHSQGARVEKMFLNVGDYAEMIVLHTKGTNLLTSVAAGPEQPSFNMNWESS